MSIADSHSYPSLEYLTETELHYVRYIESASNEPMLAAKVTRAKEVLTHIRALIQKVNSGEDVTLLLAEGKLSILPPQSTELTGTRDIPEPFDMRDSSPFSPDFS